MLFIRISLSLVGFITLITRPCTLFHLLQNLFEKRVVTEKEEAAQPIWCEGGVWIALDYVIKIDLLPIFRLLMRHVIDKKSNIIAKVLNCFEIK